MAKRYIDADALLEKRWDVPFETKDAYYVQVVDVADIENAPTADVVEVKHGEWLHENGEMVCSVCGEEALMDEVYYESPYCPDCGAKMDGKSNSEPSSNCKGCKHSYMGLPWSSAYPCNACVRAHKSDYYEQKDGRRKV